MKKNPFIFGAIGLVAMAALFGCAIAGEPRVVPMPADADKVDAKLLESDCRLDSADFPSLRLCYQVVAAKLPPIDPSKRDHFGELYDPQKFLECKMKAQNIYELNATGHCDRYRLRRIENPEYWPNSDVPKPKWPEAPSPPVYREGMTSEEYFMELCEKEAGEFIYKTVENIEGIYQIRPKHYSNDIGPSSDKYTNEAPYIDSIGLGGYKSTIEFMFVAPRHYSFFEIPAAYHRQQYPIERKFPASNRDASYFDPSLQSALVASYTGFNGNDYKTMKVKYRFHPQSRYGLTWREIKRKDDRELEITGGELAVVDLQTGDVLAIKRGFAKREQLPNAPHGIRIWAKFCPASSKNGHVISFIEQVLKPVGNKN